jgi:hypothetical protein
MLRAQLLRLWRAEQLYILAGDVQTKLVLFFHTRPRAAVKRCYTFPCFALPTRQPDCKSLPRRYNPQNRHDGNNPFS